ncbi:MAG: phosphate ABC transporter permease PstA [Polyangiaceae bacterium]|nr:phosphate ABC transporter permease PstA [Polyangiaceae bacterium]
MTTEAITLDSHSQSTKPPSDAASHLLHADFGERRRKWFSHFVVALCGVSAVVVLVPLASIFLYIINKGAPGLSLDFFTKLPTPVGVAGGGLSNAVLGTLTLIGIASAIGLPIGILAGVYVAEVGKGRVADLIRFFAEVLSGVPSITIGVFVYAVLVVPMKTFSAFAGGVSLAIIMIPTVARTTEELLRMVPSQLREASLALGVPQWKTSIFIVLRTAAPGILTGVMLGIARIAGETAPLLFTAFNNRFLSTRLDQPIASLPVQILTYATSPYAEWQQKAWTGAFVLVFVILILNLIARLGTRRQVGGAS